MISFKQVLVNLHIFHFTVEAVKFYNVHRNIFYNFFELYTLIFVNVPVEIKMYITYSIKLFTQIIITKHSAGKIYYFYNCDDIYLYILMYLLKHSSQLYQSFIYYVVNIDIINYSVNTE